MVRGAALLMVVVATPALAASQSPGRCTIEQAVARNEEKKAPPDELRFRFPRKGYDWQTALDIPRVVLKSAERRFTLNLDPYFTNSSGVVGVTGSIPADKLLASMKEFGRGKEALGPAAHAALSKHD